MIEIKNVHKAFADQKVLRGVDILVREGSSTAIIGTSGGGKSVLLKILLGLIKPDSGEVCIKGEHVSSARPTRCLLYTSPSPRDVEESRMPSSA